ncbi:MAG: hypothetical protein QF714_06765 [Dehalococcoidia bacterium]|jgi:hypothetical protein|nr:hypothetical protein [Dehalococcoidia bacterium]MDP7083703.1 hypothetical protein [Dehalococcoidia bacterium]MDP7199479.1 hypothetical protein [Dehalococcoidia bacterium]MDP7510189.1 hypothetical protein [Dehalococcoidia bacterium]HJN88303.1 hypothetical protein [Dehalococcoidia bacterium]
MQKAAILIVIFMAVGAVGLATIIWTSFNGRENATVSRDILATKTAELRDPSSFSQYPDSSSTELESASSVTPTSTPE